MYVRVHVLRPPTPVCVPAVPAVPAHVCMRAVRINPLGEDWNKGVPLSALQHREALAVLQRCALK